MLYMITFLPLALESPVDQSIPDLQIPPASRKDNYIIATEELCLLHTVIVYAFCTIITVCAKFPCHDLQCLPVIYYEHFKLNTLVTILLMNNVIVFEYFYKSHIVYIFTKLLLLLNILNSSFEPFTYCSKGLGHTHTHKGLCLILQ